MPQIMPMRPGQPMMIQPGQPFPPPGAQFQRMPMFQPPPADFTRGLLFFCMTFFKNVFQVHRQDKIHNHQVSEDRPQWAVHHHIVNKEGGPVKGKMDLMIAAVVAVDSVVVEADAVETFNHLDVVVVDSMMTAVEAVDGVAIGKIDILDFRN